MFFFGGLGLLVGGRELLVRVEELVRIVVIGSGGVGRGKPRVSDVTFCWPWFCGG